MGNNHGQQGHVPGNVEAGQQGNNGDGQQGHVPGNVEAGQQGNHGDGQQGHAPGNGAGQHDNNGLQVNFLPGNNLLVFGVNLNHLNDEINLILDFPR